MSVQFPWLESILLWKLITNHVRFEMWTWTQLFNMQRGAVSKHIWSRWLQCDDLNSDNWDPIHRLCSFAYSMRTDQKMLLQGQQLGWMLSLLDGGNVSLGVNFISWSNHCVVVWFSLSWGYFVTLSNTFHTLHAVTWWMTLSLYGGHVSLGKIFLRLSWNFRIGVILFVLVLFHTSV